MTSSSWSMMSSSPRPRPADYDFLFKVLVVGRSGVGKTTIIHGFSKNEYPPPQPLYTIGIDFNIRQVEVEGKIVKLQIWNSYRGRARMISPSYFRGCSGIMLVCDVTDEESFKDIDYWLSAAHKHCDPHVIILGNKSDLTETRQVSSERGRMFAEEHGLKFMETSAMTGENVELALMSLTKDIKYARELNEQDTKANVVSSSVNHSTTSTSSCSCL